MLTGAGAESTLERKHDINSISSKRVASVQSVPKAFHCGIDR